MGSRIAVLLRASVDAAYAIARGDDPPETLLPDLADGFDSDCGAGIAYWRCGLGDNVDRTENLASVGPEACVRSLGVSYTSGQLDRALRSASAHPQLAVLATGERSAPRLSDVVELRRFWDTEVWHTIHGVHNGRYPMGIVLSLDRHHVRFAALQRSNRDFTDAEVETAERVLRPVAGAYTFRARLDEAVAALRMSHDLRDVLTARQREVLALVARGKSDRQIASILAISESTVRKHLADARDRTQTTNRSAAAVWWNSHT